MSTLLHEMEINAKVHEYVNGSMVWQQGLGMESMTNLMY